jgi:hypothetical protein
VKGENSMNTIIVNLCEEDRQRLDRIIAALERPAPKCERCADDVAEFVDDRLRQNGLEPQATEDTAPEEKPAEEAKPEQPAVSRADIQRKVVELSAVGKKEQVREVVKEYADRVSAIPEDKLVEVWQKLTALGG